MRSISSSIADAAKSSSTVGANVHSLSSRRPSSGAYVRAVRSRRSTSRARFFAVAINHAAGLSGMPRNFQTSNARQKASWTTSSASAILWTPKMRVTADDVLGLGKRTVCHRFLFAFHQLAITLQRLALVFYMAFLTQLLEPGH